MPVRLELPSSKALSSARTSASPASYGTPARSATGSSSSATTTGPFSSPQVRRARPRTLRAFSEPHRPETDDAGPVNVRYRLLHPMAGQQLLGDRAP